jgi:hypothetical protein
MFQTIFAGGESVIVSLFINMSLNINGEFHFNLCGYIIKYVIGIVNSYSWTLVYISLCTDVYRFADAGSLYQFYCNCMTQMFIFVPGPILVSALTTSISGFNGYYLRVISILSSIWCFYVLVTFYITIKPNLSHFSPLMNFVSLKAIILFITVQQMMVGINQLCCCYHYICVYVSM